MATEEDGGNGLEFLTDPVDRFPLPDLASSDFTPPSNRDSIIPGSAYDSSMGDVGDAPLSIQLVTNAGGDAPTLSTTDSQLSTGKDDPQTAGWAKRVCVGRAPVKRLPCAGRVCALEKTLRCYAEKKTDTVVVPPIGYTFDSLGEAYDFYNLYSWEIGFGIRSMQDYGKCNRESNATNDSPVVQVACP
ncbi:Dirigent protein [Hordeum vulgare]|nr:Dirigent protein [Hordeum vulgare]